MCRATRDTGADRSNDIVGPGYRGGVEPQDRPDGEYRPHGKFRPRTPAPASLATTPASETKEPEAEPKPSRNSRLRLTLVVGTMVGLFLCLGMSVAGYVLYDRATKLDRSTPGSVLYQYLQARFEDREPDRAKLFTCKSPRLGALDALFDDLMAREKTYNVQFHVGISTDRTEIDGTSATTYGNLDVWYRDDNKTFYHDIKPWRFSFVQQDGWRLCAADRR